MRTYRLEFADDRIGQAETITFEAEDPGRAIALLSNRQPGRRAELWEGEHFICTLRQDEAGDGVWQVDTHA